MLILKLQRGQNVRIGPYVLVSCIRDKEGSLVVGIDAPPEWKIDRQPPLPDGTAELGSPSLSNTSQ